MDGIYTFWVPKTVSVHSGGGSVGVDPEGAHPPNFAQSKFYLWSTLNHSRWAWIEPAQFTPEPQTAKRLYNYVVVGS